PLKGEGKRDERTERSWCSLRQLGLVAGAVAVLVGGSFAALHLVIDRLGPPQLAAVSQLSVTVLDRHDRLLRAFPTAEAPWRLPLEPAEADQPSLAMLLAFEAKRFYRHGGVDVRSLVRATGQLVRHRRIISGASTLTMQVARLIEGKHQRTGGAKL